MIQRLNVLFGDISNIASFVSAVTAVIAVFLAIYIPRRILANQMYADLVKEYRSAEMGAAVLAVFYFFKKVCNQNTEAICKEYERLYDEQIRKPIEKGTPVDFSQTLHFQRRLVSQFYADMAVLHFDHRLTKKQMEYWFTHNETKLLAILLHMVKPAQEVFETADGIPEPPEDSVTMNQLLYWLYEEVKDAG